MHGDLKFSGPAQPMQLYLLSLLVEALGTVSQTDDWDILLLSHMRHIIKRLALLPDIFKV